MPKLTKEEIESLKKARERMIKDKVILEKLVETKQKEIDDITETIGD